MLDGFAEHGLDRGTIWVLLGPAANQANVFRLDAASGRLDQITSNPLGITWLSASAKGVVASDAVTGQEVPAVLNEGKLVPLGVGGSLTRGFTPSIAPDGRIALTRVTYSPPGGGSSTGESEQEDSPEIAPTSPTVTVDKNWELVADEVDSGEFGVVYSSQSSLAAVAWGPDGQLAVLEGGGTKNARLVVATAAQSNRQISYPQVPELNKIGVPVWSTQPGTPLAVNGHMGWSWSDTGNSVLVDLDTGSRIPLPKGWTARCWDPTGTELILSQKNKIGTISQEEPTRLTVVETLPTDIGALYNCGWGPSDP